MKRVGVFAGSFDPIHDGHLAFAKSALSRGLDKVYFLVEPRPRRKQGVRSLEHRQNMVLAAIKSQPKLGMIALGQARFSVLETLPPLRARFKGQKLVLMFGDDVVKRMVDHMADWPHVDQLAKDTELMIASRRNDHQDLIKQLEMMDKDYGLKFKYDFIEPNATDISSSRIRLSIKKHQPPAGLPAVVKNYITKHKLYSTDSTSSK